MYKFSRTTFKAMTAKEADDEMKSTSKLSNEERLGRVFYLNSIAYNFKVDSPPRFDRTAFEAKSRK